MARPPKSPHIPMRNGVSPSSLALPSLRQPPWDTVLDALAALLPRIPAAEWHTRMARGQVLDDSGAALPPDAPYQRYQRIHYWRELPDEQPIPFRHTVLLRDEHLLVVDKPHFLPVTPGGRYVQETLLVRLKHELGLNELSPLHRLDRETAGVVAFCLRPQDRDAYQRLFRERRVHKVYEALARVSPPSGAVGPAPVPDPASLCPLVRRSHIRENPRQFFRMEEAPDAEQLPPNSETRIDLIHIRDGLGCFRLEPVTGKRHQLRVHMAALGWPLLGDQFYPDVLREPGEEEDFANPLQLLARQLAFTDPVTGQQRCFESQLTLTCA